MPKPIRPSVVIIVRKKLCAPWYRPVNWPKNWTNVPQPQPPISRRPALGRYYSVESQIKPRPPKSFSSILEDIPIKRSISVSGSLWKRYAIQSKRQTEKIMFLKLNLRNTEVNKNVMRVMTSIIKPLRDPKINIKKAYVKIVPYIAYLSHLCRESLFRMMSKKMIA